MRRLALPIAICLLASYGCAASEESVPAGGSSGSSHGGTPTVGGQSPGVSGSGVVTSAGTSPGTGGAPSTAGNTSTGTAGNVTTGTAGSTPGTAGSGTGGTAPAAASCAMSASATGTPPLIDDFEDGNSDVGAVDGRVGGWFLATDGTGSTTPTAPIAPKPATGGMPGNALHVTGTGLTSWGASLSASITPAMGCYDASKFTGITVMLKGSGSIWVSVLTAAVRGAAEGQRNHYKKQVTLTTDWTPVTINFSELTQPGGWGLVVPFDATKVYGIDFGPATAPPTPTAFDFWIDNLSFKM